MLDHPNVAHQQKNKLINKLKLMKYSWKSSKHIFMCKVQQTWAKQSGYDENQAPPAGEFGSVQQQVRWHAGLHVFTRGEHVNRPCRSLSLSSLLGSPQLCFATCAVYVR